MIRAAGLRVTCPQRPSVGAVKDEDFSILRLIIANCCKLAWYRIPTVTKQRAIGAIGAIDYARPPSAIASVRVAEGEAWLTVVRRTNSNRQPIQPASLGSDEALPAGLGASLTCENTTSVAVTATRSGVIARGVSAQDQRAPSRGRQEERFVPRQT